MLYETPSRELTWVFTIKNSLSLSFSDCSCTVFNSWFLNICPFSRAFLYLSCTKPYCSLTEVSLSFRLSFCDKLSCIFKVYFLKFNKFYILFNINFEIHNNFLIHSKIMIFYLFIHYKASLISFYEF